MITVLTICAANYLAHAKLLGDSLKEHNPDYEFVIGLADHVPTSLAQSFWHPYELLPVEKIGIEALGDMVERYDVVEFSTAVKPFFIEFLYRRNPQVQSVVYLDPDVFLFGSLEPLALRLRQHDLVVTPHSCTFDDSTENIYYETGMLSTGVFNLGFLGTSRSATTFSFLEWWQRRLRAHCYYSPGSGLFVDHIWVTLAPLYFDGVYVEKNPGYNMSYWNIFERHLSMSCGRYVVNDTHDLVFYHFSSFDPEKPGEMTKRSKSMVKSFKERPDLTRIYAEYSDRLLGAGYRSVKPLQYSLRQRPFKSTFTAKAAVRASFRRILRVLPSKVQGTLSGIARVTMNSLK